MTIKPISFRYLIRGEDGIAVMVRTQGYATPTPGLGIHQMIRTDEWVLCHLYSGRKVGGFDAFDKAMAAAEVLVEFFDWTAPYEEIESAAKKMDHNQKTLLSAALSGQIRKPFPF